MKAPKEIYVVAQWAMSALAVLLVGLALNGDAIRLACAQQGAVRPTILQKGAAGRHSHPGTEIGYVLEGSATLIIEGQAAREVKAGDSWIIGAGIPHEGRAGPAGVKVIGTFVIERGKPLVTPAP